MSKFCGVISNGINHCADVESLEFGELSNVTNWLINETTAAIADYCTKHQFMEEEQQKILENERNLLNMHSRMQTLEAMIAETEQEIAANSCALGMLEERIDAMECFTNRPPVYFISPCRRGSNPPIERQEPRNGVMEMLQDTDKLITQLNMITSEMNDYQPFLLRRANPYKTIFGILGYHVQTLAKTEMYLDTLKDKIAAIDEAFAKIMNEISLYRQRIDGKVCTITECGQMTCNSNC